MLPKQLMFTVGLIDQITKPIAKISQQFNGLANGYQQGTMKMASGVGGVAAAGYTLQRALMPAIEMDRALGEVKSLGVRDEALKQLTDTSYEFALKYGKSATDFVSSSYDIQSAINGLSSADLSAFTTSSNLLAAATKSDAATITDYMGTMYGIFKNQANGMGKTQWVEQVTGMTATAVDMFKTDGNKMSAAFASIGASANSFGIKMHEQMAVLGTFQSTWSGSEAGTKYKALLAGVGKAQKILGLEFTDSQDKMLPMVDVLNKIKGKFGETIEISEGMQLDKAFGQQGAEAIKLLMNDINGLNGSIDQLGQVKGMGQAEKMAAAMTDQSQRLSQSWYVIRAAFGSAILPAFNSFVGWVADMGIGLTNFTKKHPELTKWLGYTAIALLGMVAAGGLFTIMVGASTMAMTTWKALVAVSTLVGNGYASALTFMQTRMSGLSATTILVTSKLWLKNKALAASNIATSLYGKALGSTKSALIGFSMMATTTGGYLPALSALMSGAAASTWTFVASLAAAAWPITLLIAAIVAVSVAIYKYWQPIKAFFGGFWDGLTEGFAPVGEVFSALFESFSFLGDIFSWMGEQVGFSSEELAGFAEAGKSFGGIIAGVFNALLWPIKQFINLLTGAISLIKDGVGAISEFFGFGDSPELNANLTHKQVVGAELPSNVVPFTQSVVPAALAEQSQSSNVLPMPLANQAKQARDLTARPDNLIELPALKLERTQAQPNFTNNSNANSTDNSKRFHIENMSMKSDDPAQFFQNMLEMTG